MPEYLHTDLITHSTWMSVLQSFISIIFALIALMIIRKLVYMDYRPVGCKCKEKEYGKAKEWKESIDLEQANSELDWKELAKDEKDFLSVSIYHSVVFAFTSLLLIAILN